MEELGSNNKINLNLNKFESLEDIEASVNWDIAFKQKLAARNQNKAAGSSFIKLTLVAVIVLINISYLFKTYSSNNRSIPESDMELSLISKELLINPTSLNN